MKPNRFIPLHTPGVLKLSAGVITQGPAEFDRMQKARDEQRKRFADWKPRALPIDQQRLEFGTGNRSAAR